MKAGVVCKPVCAALLFFSWQNGSHAFDRASIEALTGNQSQLLRVGLQSPSAIELPALPAHGISLSWEGSFGYWRENRPDNAPSRTESLFDIGLTPVLRWGAQKSCGWFGEAGVGAHWLSRQYNNNGREFSTRLQFASFLGGGYRFINDFTLSVKAEHVSNGGIKHPNPGVNFVGVQLGKVF